MPSWYATHTGCPLTSFHTSGKGVATAVLSLVARFAGAGGGVSTTWDTDALGANSGCDLGPLGWFFAALFRLLAMANPVWRASLVDLRL